MQKREIAGIQYLRGLASLAVVLDHTAGMANFEKYFGQEVLGGLLYRGAIGVDLFFMISGFIICIIGLDDSFRPALSAKTFFEKRFARIIPLMWSAILSYAVLRFVGRGEFEPFSYLRALTLFPVGSVTPNNIWTLRHEALFYILFAVSFLGYSLRPYILGIWVAAPVVFIVLGLPRDGSTLFEQFIRIVAHPVNIEFGAGFLLGLAWLRSPSTQVLRVPGSPFLLLAVLFSCLVVAAYIFKLESSTVWQTSITALLCTPILLIATYAECPISPLDRIGRMLGDASYSIYLFHPHFVSAILGIWVKLAPNTNITIVLMATAAASIFGGLVIHFWIEKPLIRLCASLFSTTKTPSAA
jgi:exopolysaccharide production protein ExoZ